MNQTTVDVIIGAITFFVTAIVNALALGFFLGGIRSDVAALRREVAKIEGAFTLVPTQPPSNERSVK